MDKLHNIKSAHSHTQRETRILLSIQSRERKKELVTKTKSGNALLGEAATQSEQETDPKMSLEI